MMRVVTPRTVLGVVAAVLLGAGMVGLCSQSDEQELLAAFATTTPYPGAVVVSVQDQGSRVRRVYVANASATAIGAFYADALPKSGWRVVTDSSRTGGSLCAERSPIRLQMTYSVLPPGSYTYVMELTKNATCEP
jgi:hypothetical protein